MPQYDKMQVYHDGEFKPLFEAKLSIWDSINMLGDGVFEMTRTFAHKPFQLDQHIDRLYRSMKLAEIDPGISQEQLKELSLQVLELNKPYLEPELDFFIRHDVSRGVVPYYARCTNAKLQPTVVIAAVPLIEHVARVSWAFEEGIHAVVPVQRSIPSYYLDPKLKTRSRLHYQMANLQAQRVDPRAWALMMDEHGFLTEGTSSNFHLVKGDTVYTPEGRNILRGISRSYVAEVAAAVGLKYEERNLEPYDVHAADEAFFTASSYCLVPVSRFDCRPIGNGKPGPVVKSLLDEWSRRVGVDIVAQSKLAEKYL